jgi:hypothetical protein
MLRCCCRYGTACLFEITLSADRLATCSACDALLQQARTYMHRVRFWLAALPGLQLAGASSQTASACFKRDARPSLYTLTLGVPAPASATAAAATAGAVVLQTELNVYEQFAIQHCKGMLAPPAVCHEIEEAVLDIKHQLQLATKSSVSLSAHTLVHCTVQYSTVEYCQGCCCLDCMPLGPAELVHSQNAVCTRHTKQCYVQGGVAGSVTNRSLSVFCGSAADAFCRATR